MSELQDLENEATTPDPGEASIQFRELTLTFKSDRDTWSVELLEAIDDRKSTTWLRELLGPDQWKSFKALEPAPTVADIKALDVAISEYFGLKTPGK